MRLLRFIPIVALAMLLAACHPLVSFQKWFADDNCTPAPELEGTWVLEDGEAVLTIVAEGSSYSLSLTSEGIGSHGSTGRYKARIARRGSFYLLDVEPQKEVLDEFFKREFIQPVLPVHILARIELDGDQMRISFPDKLPTKIESGEVPIAHYLFDWDEDVLILLAETGELQELAFKHGEEPEEKFGEASPRFNRQPPEVGHFYRGKLYKKGSPEAEVAFLEALEAKPGYAAAHDGLGRTYLERGSFDAAISSYDQAISFDRNNPEFHRHLAYALMAAGRISSALHESRVALQLDPDEAESHFQLALALFLDERFADAADEFAKASRILQDQDWRNGLPLYALALERSGHEMQAQELLKSEIQKRPYAALPLFFTRKIDEQDLLRQLGQWGAAEAHFFIGERFLQEGDAQRAREHFIAVLRSGGNPGSFEAIAARVKLARLGGY